MYGHPYARNLFTDQKKPASAGFAFCLGAASVALAALVFAAYLTH